MQLLHDPSRVSSVFDDPNLVSCAGLAPVLALAGRAGLNDLVAESLTLNQPGGVNAVVKVPVLVAGMVAGADSIDDMDLLRHGGMGRLFTGVRAPSTLGTFLRSFTFGHVRQLDKVAASFLAGLTANAPVLRDAGTVTYVDMDDTVKATYGYAKQGAGYGYSGVKGLNALIVTASTPLSAPMITGTRLRKGSTNSARGAARLLAQALTATKACGGDPKNGALVITRVDSAFYNHKVIGAARRHGSRISVTARMTKPVKKAIASIPEDAWTPIQYPSAIWDEDEQRLISDAEVAEIPAFTAFTSQKKKDQVTARLIVRRVKRLNPKTVTGEGKTAEQDGLFDVWRYHAVFTDSPFSMLEAEADHRRHAIIEGVHADLRNGPLAHLPSGNFQANAAWLACAAMAFNLTRAAGALASPFHAKATGATIRHQLISVPARLARTGIKSGRARTGRLTLHLPAGWPWEEAWTQLFTATTRPPPIAA